MATTNINASKQTFATSGTQSTWSAARNATSSDSHINYTSQANKSTAISEFWSSGRGGGTAAVHRSFFFFDTTLEENGTITAIDLKIYNSTSINTGNAVRVAKSTAYNTGGGSAYADSEFNNWTTLSSISLSPIPYTTTNHTWTGPGTNTLSLNSTAISNANSDDYLNLVLVGGGHDYLNSAPSGDIEYHSQIQFASSTEYPKLVITYTPSGYGNDVNGVASANIASVNGVATANIASINSVT